MNNEENIKQEWQTPEIVDLNADKTASGSLPAWDETMTSIGVS